MFLIIFIQSDIFAKNSQINSRVCYEGLSFDAALFVRFICPRITFSLVSLIRGIKIWDPFKEVKGFNEAPGSLSLKMKLGSNSRMRTTNESRTESHVRER